jgi:hypothetical protein
MELIERDGIKFGGQYKKALLKLEDGGKITLRDFSNGSWEPTTQIGDFYLRVSEVYGDRIQTEGESLRQMVIWLEN